MSNIRVKTALDNGWQETTVYQIFLQVSQTGVDGKRRENHHTMVTLYLLAIAL
jgi:hypothetical protein